MRFRRRAGMYSLPVPVPGGSVDDLRPYVNLKHGFALFVSYLLAALRGRGPFPLLVLLGEAGVAKSTALRVVKALVDPTKIELRAPPRENRDLFIAANKAIWSPLITCPWRIGKSSQKMERRRAVL